MRSFIILMFASLVLFCSTPIMAANMIWSATNESGKTFFIVGSIHLSNNENYELNNSFKDAFDKSDYLVLEINLENDKNLAAMNNIIFTKAIYTNSTLLDNISDETKRVLEENNLLDQSMMNLKPWLLSNMILMKQLNKIGYSPKDDTVAYFTAQANAQNKPIYDLETIDEQLSVFYNMSDEEQEKYLLYSAQSIDKLKPFIDNLFNLWEQGDLAAIGAAFLQDYKDSGLDNFIDNLVYKRNYNMLAKINELTNELDGVGFFIVGSIHLYGEQGILQKLESSGYTIKQL